jgi:hypothetical protein
MILIKAAAIAMAFLAVPATAQSLSDTHEMHWNQAGKVPAVHYRPVKNPCVPQIDPIHLSRKTPLNVHDGSKSNCASAPAIAVVSNEADATTEKQ